MFKVLLIFGFVVIIHLVMLALNKGFKRNKSQSLLAKFWEKGFKFLTFAIYIRYILLAFSTIWLSSFNEIYQLKIDTQSNLASYVLNILILILVVVFVWISIWQIVKSHPTLKNSKNSYFKEYFAGFKDKTTSRIFIMIIWGQKILSSLLVVMFVGVDSAINIGMITVIHVASFVYLIAVRPYELVRNSILEWITTKLHIYFLFCHVSS